jgi:hypothetical protein
LLLKSFIHYFGCGNTYSYKNYIEYRCQDFGKIYEIILPFFYKYQIMGIKSQDFRDWANIAEMMNQKVHLTSEGFDKIYRIRTGMNKYRKFSIKALVV